MVKQISVSVFTVSLLTCIFLSQSHWYCPEIKVQKQIENEDSRIVCSIFNVASF